MDQIARRTYKVKNFNGDNYLSREEVNTFIKPKITKKPATKKTPPPHVKKKSVGPQISYKDYILNQIFRRWLEDNITELQETFDEIIYCYKKNDCVFTKKYDDIFKEYASMVFRTNIAEIRHAYA